MLFHRLSGDQQTQARAPMTFGAEKRGEKPGQHLLAHSHTIIRYADPETLAIFEFALDRDLPSFTRIFIKQAGINGIGNQIGQTLVDGMRVHDHRVNGTVQFCHQFDLAKLY